MDLFYVFNLILQLTGRIELPHTNSERILTTDNPNFNTEHRKGQHFTAEERHDIEVHLKDGWSKFNTRRYGDPWVAKVDPATKRPDFKNRVGEYTGGRSTGNEGDLRVYEPVDGAVYMFGQKDYRGTTNNSYAQYLNGEFVPVDRSDLSDALKKGEEISKSTQANEASAEKAPSPKNNTVRKEPANEEKAAETSLKETENRATMDEDKEKSIREVSPQSALADKIIPLIQSGEEFDSRTLFKMADDAFGGTQAQGVYTVKDAYDGMELAINSYLMNASFVNDGNKDSSSAVETLSRLQNFLKKIPTQTKRTEEQQLFQQFSTPPTIAYLAAWSANIGKDNVVLEPSAGIGGLALFPKAWGATVYGNEYSERRLKFLNELGLDGTYNLNAEQLDNLLPDEIKPSVVIMNPPFSSTAGRTSTIKTANATRHIEQALERLQPGGRLVAILGRGMSEDASSFKKWWGKIKSEYSVRANVRIDGTNYTKYGTSFDVQLVVIDKTGAQNGVTLTGTVNDMSELPGMMEGIRNDRTRLDGNVRNVPDGNAGSIRQSGNMVGDKHNGVDAGSTSWKLVWSGTNGTEKVQAGNEGRMDAVSEDDERAGNGKRDNGNPESGAILSGQSGSSGNRTGNVGHGHGAVTLENPIKKNGPSN